MVGWRTTYLEGPAGATGPALLAEPREVGGVDGNGADVDQVIAESGKQLLGGQHAAVQEAGGWRPWGTPGRGTGPDGRSSRSRTVTVRPGPATAAAANSPVVLAPMITTRSVGMRPLSVHQGSIIPAPLAMAECSAPGEGAGALDLVPGGPDAGVEQELFGGLQGNDLRAADGVLPELVGQRDE